MTPGERKHIRAALREAANVGFYPVYVYDGEARQRGGAHFMLDSEVLAACESVDDSHIHFVNLNSQHSRQWARVILGNACDGSEVIADNSCSDRLFDGAMSRAMGIAS